MKKSMVDILANLLIKAGVLLWPKKKALFLASNDVVKVTRCGACRHVRETDSPDGTVWYCPIHEHSVSPRGYCHNSE